MPKKSLKNKYEFKYLMFQYPYRFNELAIDLEREFGGKILHKHLLNGVLKIKGIKFNITKVDGKLSGLHAGTGNRNVYFIELSEKVLS